MAETAGRPLTLHASAVASGSRAVLITGASGTGKSALALDLITRGARLIADDRVCLTRDGDRIKVSAPGGAKALIEARGLGILDLGPMDRDPDPPRDTAQTRPNLACIVDLDATSEGRLPPRQFRDLLGVPVPLLSAKGAVSFAPVLVAILRGAVLHDPDTPI